jgi:hypothetical protein
MIDDFTFAEVRKILVAALKGVAKERKLFSYRIDERTLTQRLSLHLQPSFKDPISVDCEYNRMWEDNEDIVKELPWGAEEVWTDDCDGRTVYPDIIVHERGGQFQNLLVIEAKRNHGGIELPVIDLMKLERFTHPGGDFRYRYGAFVNFLTLADPKQVLVNWFQNGELVEHHDEIDVD